LIEATTTAELGFANGKPQDPKMQGPYLGEGNSGNCNIYVNFKPGTSYVSGRPNGPSTAYLDGVAFYGLGFTVGGSVKGGIGKIGEERNGQNPNGGWTMDQWTSRYIEEGGKEVWNDRGKDRRDISGRVLYWATGDSFTWYDHPSAQAGKTVTYRAQNFRVSV